MTKNEILRALGSDGDEAAFGKLIEAAGTATGDDLTDLLTLVFQAGRKAALVDVVTDLKDFDEDGAVEVIRNNYGADLR